MNKKEIAMYKIVDEVVKCCQMEVGEGVMSVTKEDVLGKDRRENVVMTRCIVVRQLSWSGFSKSTIAMLLGRSVQAVRHLEEVGAQYHKSSRAYRIAEAEATIKCRDIEMR